MFGRSGSCLLVVSLLTLAPLLSSGQTAYFNPRQATPDFAPHPPQVILSPLPEPGPIVSRVPVYRPIGAREMVRAAGMIFSGTVTRIERRPATRGQSVETVAITFRVETAIRGATPGNVLTISQWIGLWSSGQRYRVGERVFLFLYPPSKVGLTSCVAGLVGRFNLDAWGSIWLSAQHLSVFRTDPVLGGKSHVRFRDFASAVRRASEEE
jgi:hypothetical protein